MWFIPCLIWFSVILINPIFIYSIHIDIALRNITHYSEIKWIPNPWIRSSISLLEYNPPLFNRHRCLFCYKSSVWLGWVSNTQTSRYLSFMILLLNFYWGFLDSKWHIHIDITAWLNVNASRQNPRWPQFSKRHFQLILNMKNSVFWFKFHSNFPNGSIKIGMASNRP